MTSSNSTATILPNSETYPVVPTDHKAQAEITSNHEALPDAQPEYEGQKTSGATWPEGTASDPV